MVYSDAALFRYDPLDFDNCSGQRGTKMREYIVIALVGVFVYYFVFNPNVSKCIPYNPTTGIRAMLANVVAGNPNVLKVGGDEAKVEKLLKDILAKDSQVVIMVYANWCGHCKQAMESFQKEAKGCKVVCVDSSTLPDQGAKIVGKEEIEYFPTVALKDKNGMVEEVDVTQALEIVKKVPNTSGVVNDDPNTTSYSKMTEDIMHGGDEALGWR